MATEIINNGASLKIVTNGAARNISKQQIRETSIVNNNIVKLDLGLGTFKDVFIPFPEVTAPVAATPEALMDAINAMLLGVNSGLATEQQQNQGISELLNIKSSLAGINDKMQTLNDKLLQDALLVDETVPGAIFRGFATPGSPTPNAVWAIQKVTNNNGIISHQWAGGNKNFDKVWDDRVNLVYA